MEREISVSPMEQRNWDDKTKRVIENNNIKEEDFDMFDELRGFSTYELNDQVDGFDLAQFLREENDDLEPLKKHLASHKERADRFLPREDLPQGARNKIVSHQRILEIISHFAENYNKQTAFRMFFIAERT